MAEKAVIYLRVSTSRQIEKSQQPDCEKFCKENGYEIVDIFKDHAKSAYKNVERPAYNKVMELVKKREINHVVVWAIDRWTRRGPKELKNSISYLTAHNVNFHAVKEQWIESINMPGSMGQVIRDFMFGMLAWLAEAESQRRSERLKASEKYQKALDKGLVGRSSLPDEVVKEVLKKIDEGLSYRKIHQLVTYKAKYGKVKHISLGKITDIAKSRKQ